MPKSKTKTSTLTPRQIKDFRALCASTLQAAGLKIPDLRAILRCHGPDEVRQLQARGQRLARELPKL